jgi:hypothetical protein
MAFHTASLRDMGVSRERVEAQLKQEVKGSKELMLALMVVTLVYNGQGSPLALKREVLRKCQK